MIEAVNRWVLIDPSTSDRYVFPINPNQMAKPHPRKGLVAVPSLKWGARTLASPRGPQEWQFSGVIRTKEMHDALAWWVTKSVLVTVNDHLDRNYQVLLNKFDFSESQPSRRKPWKGTYVMHATLFTYDEGP